MPSDHAAVNRALADLTRASSSGTPPFGVPIGKTRFPTSPDQRLASFVRGAMTAYENVPGLLDLQVLVSAHTRRSNTDLGWITLYDWLDDGARNTLVARSAQPSEVEPYQVIDAHKRALVRPIRRRGTGAFGHLIALFESDAAAHSADGAIEALVEDLAVGLGVRRLILAAEAAQELSTAVAEVGTHHEALSWITDSLCASMRSDGAKVHVLQRTPGGPRVELVLRTEATRGPRPRHALSRKSGFVDWVLLNNDWLMFPAAGAEGSTPGVLFAQTGRHGIVALAPGWNDTTLEPEGRATLLVHQPRFVVPLRVRGRVLGVLTLWRNTGDPYDAETDRPLAEQLTRHVAAGCRWLVQAEVMQRAVSEVSSLGRVAALGETSHAVYHALAAGVGRLAEAGRAVLLVRDDVDADRRSSPLGEQQATAFFGAAVWCGMDEDGVTDVWGVRYDTLVHGDPSGWNAALQDALAGRHAAPKKGGPPLSKGADAAHGLGGGLVLRKLLPAWVAHDRSGMPEAVVALFDPVLAEHERRPTVDEGLSEDAAATFLEQVAPTALESYPRAFAQKVARELSDPSAMALSEGPEEMLRRAAALLAQRTGADAVLVYRMEQGKMVVVSSAPPCEALLGLAAGQHTLEAYQSQLPVRVRDVQDDRSAAHERLDHATLAKIAEAYGWSGVRSWLCFPLVERGRSIGLLKLLTRSGGRVLDPCAAAVVEAVAARATAEIRRMNGALMLAGLNDLAMTLGGKERHQLANAMGNGIEKWLRRFVQPGCHVAIVASVRSPQPRLFSFCRHLSPDRFDADNAELLATLYDVGRREREDPGRMRDFIERVSLPSGRRWTLTGNARLGEHQMLVPIDAPGNVSLLAWMLIAGDRPFLQEDLEAAREASREVSIFLDYEHRRQIWAHQVARFRHAVIGPMQGLTSAARMLAHLAIEHVPEHEKARVKGLSLRIDEEAEATRLWRENQRIYMAERVEVVPKTQPLRPVVERCAQRFTEILRGRGIQLILNWRPRGSVDFAFDADALDLVLTNLLDNARKYAFFNRDIEMTVETDKELVRIWVEDVGHAIPERLAQSIYRVGERLDWKDPIRAIDGTGLGLPMARALVEAHGGTIRHVSTRTGTIREGGSHQPHKVRFTVELPHQWRR